MKNIFIIVLFFLVSIMQAHSGKNTIYEFYQLNDKEWVLDIQMNTTLLYEEIIKNHPNLKNSNMNSNDFKAAVSLYFMKNVALKEKSIPLNLAVASMKFGGHQSYLKMSVKDTFLESKDIQFYSTCFAENDHQNTHQLTIFNKEEAKTIQLSQETNTIAFSFKSMRYYSIRPSSRYYLLYVLCGLSLIPISILVRKFRKG